MLLLLPNLAYALSFQLEKSEELGTTAVARGVAVGDVDADRILEIVTAGSAYDGTRNVGQLRIWSWIGGVLTLKHSQDWFDIGNTGAIAVALGDVDGDGVVEIVTVGDYYDGTRYNAQLRISSFVAGVLGLEAERDWFTKGNTFAFAVALGDVDNDGQVEIITEGAFEPKPCYLCQAQLRIWSWNGNTLTLEKSKEWSGQKGDLYGWSVAVGDVDNDGVREIVTGGSQVSCCQGGVTSGASSSKGDLRIWSWIGGQLTLEKNALWSASQGGVYPLLTVGIGDVDNDGVLEIVTGGFRADGSTMNPELRIWTWLAGALTLEKVQDWYTGSTFIGGSFALAVGNVDSDPLVEMVTASNQAISSPSYYVTTFRVWAWDQSALTLKAEAVQSAAILSAGISDVDQDAIVEIATGECEFQVGCRLRIWSLVP